MILVSRVARVARPRDPPRHLQPRPRWSSCRTPVRGGGGRSVGTPDRRRPGQWSRTWPVSRPARCTEARTWACGQPGAPAVAPLTHHMWATPSTTRRSTYDGAGLCRRRAGRTRLRLPWPRWGSRMPRRSHRFQGHTTSCGSAPSGGDRRGSSPECRAVDRRAGSWRGAYPSPLASTMYPRRCIAGPRTCRLRPRGTFARLRHG